jgi:hypothetical protein
VVDVCQRHRVSNHLTQIILVAGDHAHKRQQDATRQPSQHDATEYVYSAEQEDMHCPGSGGKVEHHIAGKESDHHPGCGSLASENPRDKQSAQAGRRARFQRRHDPAGLIRLHRGTAELMHKALCEGPDRFVTTHETAMNNPAAPSDAHGLPVGGSRSPLRNRT